MPASICRRASRRTPASSSAPPRRERRDQRRAAAGERLSHTSPPCTLSTRPDSSSLSLQRKLRTELRAHSPSTSRIVNQPLRPCTQRAASSAPRAKPRSIARGVRQRDRLAGRVEADRVRARDGARARRRDVDRAIVAAAAHRRLEQQRRARRRIPLGRVVGLVDPGAERRVRRQQLAPRARRARRTGSRRARSSAPRRRRCRCASTSRAHVRLVRVPPGRADDDVDAARGRAAATFAGTASAVEKSIATSAAGQLAGVAAFARTSTVPATSHAVLGASDSTSLPIRPWPTISSMRIAAPVSCSSTPSPPSPKNSRCSRAIAAATIRVAQHDRHVPPRRRLRDHPQRNPSSAPSTRAGDARIVAQIVADGAQDRHLALDADLGELAQRRRRSPSSRASSSTVTDTLTSDVVTTSTGGAMALEDLEQRRRKPCAISIRVDVMSTTSRRACRRGPRAAGRAGGGSRGDERAGAVRRGGC